MQVFVSCIEVFCVVKGDNTLSENILPREESLEADSMGNCFSVCQGIMKMRAADEQM